MSSSVCQGLQSCLVDQPRLLRLKLVPPRSPHAAPAGFEKLPSAVEWSFSQALAVLPSHIRSHSDNEKSSNEKVQQAYVHPLAKRSVSLLTAMSLEMCTESLGNETGSGVIESDSESEPHNNNNNNDKDVVCDSGGTDAPRLLLPEAGGRTARNKLARTGSFPPPLTSTGVQVRSRREGGRLVMEAVAVSTCRSFFHVERSQGRLRVRFSEDHWCVHGTHEKEEEEEEEDVEMLDEEDDDEEEENEFIGEDVEGNCGIVEGEIGKEKLLPRPSTSMSISWCKGGESGSGALLNWKAKPCWVAT